MKFKGCPCFDSKLLLGFDTEAILIAEETVQLVKPNSIVENSRRQSVDIRTYVMQLDDSS